MQNNTTGPAQNEKFGPAETGNASNPSPHEGSAEPEGSQLLNEKAEKYLREVAPIEDYPDEQDWEEANNTIEKNKPAPGDSEA
jgi:hypothetical protein